MVRIINGEIVQDDDPRLKPKGPPGYVNPNRLAGRSGSGSGIRGVHDTEPSPVGSGNTQLPNIARATQQQVNPFDLIAQRFGISDYKVDIPAIPQLGFTPTRVGLIYFILLGLLMMIFGWQAIIFALVMYGIFKHSEKNKRS